MANPILILNQPQVFVGLGTLNYTVPSTGAGLYSVVVSSTVPTAIATGDGAGSNTGLGSGAGGGDAAGFARGGLGLGNGGVGQSVGSNSGYNQPPAYGSNQTSGPAISSSLSITVTQNGSTIYTSNTIAPTQGQLQFKQIINAANNDAIAVVLSSSNANDTVPLNALLSTISIQQGA